MSIGTYIAFLANLADYRLKHLDKFTDQLFIKKDSLNKECFFEEDFSKTKQDDTYELCDLIYSLELCDDPIDKFPLYENLIEKLLFSCEEHEPTRTLRKLTL